MEINLLYIVIVIATIFLSMTLHEAMHAFVSYWLGDDTAKKEGRLTLNPLKHIDPFLTIILPVMLALFGLPIFGGAKPVPFRPDRVKGGDWGAALVALGGPLTNLIIAFIATGVWALMGYEVSGIGAQIITIVITVNLGFFVFNMIPIPPLDGSRVLYALAPEFIRKGMEFLERYGLIVVFALVLIAAPLLGTFMSNAVNAIMDLFMAIFRVN